MPAISLRHVSKRFTLQQDRARSFQDLFLNAVRRRQRREADTYWALRDVSFDVQARRWALSVPTALARAPA